MQLQDYMICNNAFHISNVVIFGTEINVQEHVYCVKSILLQTKFDLMSFEELVYIVLYAN